MSTLFLFSPALSSTTALYTLSLHDALPILPPEIFQSLGRTELVPAVSRSRRGNGLEFTHDAISHRRPSIDVVGLIFLRSSRSEEHTSEIQSRGHLVCRLLLEKKKESILLST